MLDRNAQSASGFSADDVLANTPELKSIPLKYASGGSTTLAIDTHYTGPTTYDACKEVELGVNLHFVSADGVFTETLAATLLAGRKDQASSATLVSRAALQGGFSTRTDAVSMSAQTLRFSVAFVAGKAVGDVSAYDTQTHISTAIATF